MRVLWTGTFDPDFSRNRKLARLMDLSGIRWRVIRENVWASDRITLASRPSILVAVKALVGYPKLLIRLLMAPAPDLYLVSYPGWLDVPVVRLVASLKRKPLVFDPFLSLFDTMISDRGLHGEKSIVARLAAAADRWSLRLSDVVIADTEPQLAFYRQTAGALRSDGAVIAVGADDELFTPRSAQISEADLVLYYGKLIPLHGVGTIVEAAALVEPEGIRTVMIGDGPDRHVVEDAIGRTGVGVEQHGMIPIEELPEHLARAGICLGVFGESEKAGRVIPHKAYEAMATRRPVITREGPAVSSMFSEDEMVTVPPGDPVALANAIRSLAMDTDRRRRIADAGYEAYRSRFHEIPLAAGLLEVFVSALGSRDLPRL
ncbi:MAG: glycosyl transferase group 1 [Acidimicrobiia bacterium]|jgi:glycosyltransferase involved in cell wall biosynthesis|nr:glycosyl transferase group 1 [Acidimicrobiia bacterium]